jgi:hypothetical protein
MNPADAARLKETFVRESRSLLRYVRGAALWVGRDRPLLDVVMRIADEDAARLDELAGLLDDNRITIPAPGAFPMAFTDLNFVAVRSVVPKLRAELRVHLGALEADDAALAEPSAKAALRSLTESHRKHLAELDSLTV